MKPLLVLLAGLAIASAAIAQVDPRRPMITGRGNTAARPGQIVVSNQTKPNTPAVVALEKFEVTGSLLRPAAKPGELVKR